MTATTTAPTSATAVALRVDDLSVHYDTKQGVVRAVDHVSFDLASGERLGLVGESGSGKSTIALALMQMIKPPGRIAGGRVVAAGGRRGRQQADGTAASTTSATTAGGKDEREQRKADRIQDGTNHRSGARCAHGFVSGMRPRWAACS